MKPRRIEVDGVAYVHRCDFPRGTLRPGGEVTHPPDEFECPCGARYRRVVDEEGFTTGWRTDASMYDLGGPYAEPHGGP